MSREDRNSHDLIRKSILDLEEIEYAKIHQNVTSKVRGEVQNEVVSLLGEKCAVKCILGGLRFEDLWDTGGQ